MEITIGSEFKSKNPYGDGWLIIKKVYGICNELNNFKDGGVEIDSGIVNLVVLLNQKGFYTWACCSGLDEDHADFQENGYMSFGNQLGVEKITNEQWVIVRDLALQAGFNETGDNYKPPVKVFYIWADDKKKKEVWTKFYNLVKDHAPKT